MSGDATSHPESHDSNPTDPGGARIGLVLGAGGSAGGAFTRGCFTALEDTTGFQPSMATQLLGTSIGAYISARIPDGAPATPTVLAALLDRAAIPAPPSSRDRVLTTIRSLIGRSICFAKPPGREDPRQWVEAVDPTSMTRVVSARCRAGTRRVVPIKDSPTAELDIAASGAVPIGAKPVILDGAGHIDGAVLSVTNADLIDLDSIDLLIVIAPLVSTGDGGSLLSRAGRRQLHCELAGAAKHGVPTIVLAPPGSEYEHRQNKERHQAFAESMVRSGDFSW